MYLLSNSNVPTACPGSSGFESSAFNPQRRQRVLQTHFVLPGMAFIQRVAENGFPTEAD